MYSVRLSDERRPTRPGSLSKFDRETGCGVIGVGNVLIYRVAQKSKQVPNYQKIVLNGIKACEWD